MFDNGKKMMASLALFRKLYKSERTDILTLLAEFIKLIIEKNKIYSFTTSDIKNRLYTEYNFSIPESVIETSLRKFCNKEKGCYSLKNAEIDSSKKGSDLSNEDTSTIEESNRELMNKLLCYVEKKANVKLESSEKDALVQAFCEFIIEDTTQVKYADYISAFIIECQNDPIIKEQLKTIKEGVILYTGIKYNDNLAEVGSWKNDFTIYLEQEILFHFVGYNGELYKKLFNDFIELIKEVNKKAKKEVIRLQYFPEVESNINKFFSIAQRIADGKETLDPSNTAMNIIVTGCEDGTDVLTKKSQFYELLKASSIHVSDDIYISDEDKKFYNLYTTELESELTENIDDSTENIQRCLTFINYINVCRKKKESSLERSKCILLTGNNTTLRVDSSLKENGYVPYATTLDFITYRIWRKLNKGFGDNKYPKSFDVVTKAQIVLSSHIAGSVSQEFEKLKQNLSTGVITKDIAARTLNDLKTQVLKPEEINSDNTNEALITIGDIEKAKRELDNQRYEYELTNKKLETTKEEKYLAEQERDEIKDTLLFRENELFQERSQKLEVEKEKKEKADRTYKIYNRLIRSIYYLSPLILTVLIIFLICYYSWDIMERCTYLLPLFPYIFWGLSNFIWGRSIKPQNILSKITDKIKCRLYRKYNVDESEIDRLIQLTSIE